MTSTPAAAAAEQPGPSVTASAAHAAGQVTPTAGLAKLVSPLAAIGATWGVRKALDSAYHKASGGPPPRANDPDESLRRVLLWAAVSAAALAIVNVVIDRATARYSRNHR